MTRLSAKGPAAKSPWTRKDQPSASHFARIFGIEALYRAGRWRELTARLGEVAAAYVGGGTRYFAEIVDIQTGWLADLLDDRPEAARARVQDVSS